MIEGVTARLILGCCHSNVADDEDGAAQEAGGFMKASLTLPPPGT